MGRKEGKNGKLNQQKGSTNHHGDERVEEGR